jgi:hypothetical protein
VIRKKTKKNKKTNWLDFIFSVDYNPKVFSILKLFSWLIPIFRVLLVQTARKAGGGHSCDVDMRPVKLWWVNLSWRLFCEQAVTTAVALEFGLGSSLFAVALCFTVITMYDAAGVRRHAGLSPPIHTCIAAFDYPLPLLIAEGCRRGPIADDETMGGRGGGGLGHYHELHLQLFKRISKNLCFVRIAGLLACPCLSGRLRLEEQAFIWK